MCHLSLTKVELPFVLFFYFNLFGVLVFLALEVLNHTLSVNFILHLTEKTCSRLNLYENLTLKSPVCVSMCMVCLTGSSNAFLTSSPYLFLRHGPQNCPWIPRQSSLRQHVLVSTVFWRHWWHVEPWRGTKQNPRYVGQSRRLPPSQ